MILGSSAAAASSLEHVRNADSQAALQTSWVRTAQGGVPANRNFTLSPEILMQTYSENPELGRPELMSTEKRMIVFAGDSHGSSVPEEKQTNKDPFSITGPRITDQSSRTPQKQQQLRHSLCPMWRLPFN